MSTTPNEYINIYTGTVTDGGKDGDLVSQNQLQTSPVTVSLDAKKNEVKYILCAVRTQKGYKSTKTAISFVGQTRTKWRIALDAGFKDDKEAKAKGLFKNSLLITNDITDTNTLFWLEISSSDDEKPKKDVSVSIRIDSFIVTV